MKVASPNGDGYFFRRSVNFVDTSVADEASLFRGRLPISGYAGSADWFEPTVHSLLGYLRAKSRICGGELTCLQQPQAPLDLLAVFHI